MAHGAQGAHGAHELLQSERKARLARSFENKAEFIRVDLNAFVELEKKKENICFRKV